MDITTDIPIPDTRHGVGKQPKYPFAKLPVGGSFGVEAGEGKRLSLAAVKWKLRHPGWNYTTRKVGGECRLWRTE